MANERNANTFFIDTASGSSGAKLEAKNVLVSHVILTATSANAILTLKDVDTGKTKFPARQAATGQSIIFDISDNPILFPNGIDPTAVTNCEALVIFREQRA